MRIYWRPSVFFWSSLCSSQIGDDPQKDLSRFGNMLNMKIKVFKHLPIFLATYLNHIWKFGKFSLFFENIQNT
jgi:hypothetical protein